MNENEEIVNLEDLENVTGGRITDPNDYRVDRPCPKCGKLGYWVRVRPTKFVVYRCPDCNIFFTYNLRTEEFTINNK